MTELRTHHAGLRVILLAIPILFISACGTLQIGDETEKTPVRSQVVTPSPAQPPDIPNLAASTATTAPLVPTSSVASASAPDGLRIAYLSQGDIWIKDGDRSPRQLTVGADAIYLLMSNDGRRIIYLAPSGETPGDLRAARNLYVVDSDTLEQTLLLSVEEIQEMYPPPPDSVAPTSLQVGIQFIPNSHTILFQTTSPAYESWRSHGDLWSLDVDSRELEEVIPAGKANGWFTVSPDGFSIAFAEPQRIRLAHRDSRADPSELLALPLVQCEWGEGPTVFDQFPSLSWTADSSAVVVTSATECVTTAERGLNEIKSWFVRIDGTPPETVNPAPPSSRLHSIDFSPDLQQMAFITIPQSQISGDLFQLYVQKQGQQGVSPYAMGRDLGFEGWSKDGAHFVFSEDKAGGIVLSLGKQGTAPIELGRGSFMAWIDDEHFLYGVDEAIMLGEIGADAIKVIDVVDSLSNVSFTDTQR